MFFALFRVWEPLLAAQMTSCSKQQMTVESVASSVSAALTLPSLSRSVVPVASALAVSPAFLSSFISGLNWVSPWSKR